MEYTLYFLAGGNVPLTNVSLCDMVPPNSSYVPGSLELAFGNSAATTLSDGADGDRGEFFPVGNLPAVPCPSLVNDHGAVVVTVAQSPAQLTPTTGPGNPANSYGYVRFRVTVD